MRIGLGRRRPDLGALDPRLLAAIRGAVAPELGAGTPADVGLTVSWMQTREKSRLAALRAEAGNASRELILKQLLLGADGLPFVDPADASRRKRPQLAVPGSRAERLRREYVSLRAVEDSLINTPIPGLRAVHPIAHLGEHHALILERFPGRNLRRALGASLDRVRRLRRGRIDDADAHAAVRHAGAWLRSFHRSDTAPDEPHAAARPTRHATVPELSATARELCAFLADRVGPPAYFDALCTELEARIGASLPARLPLGKLHGDFAPRNVIVAPDGAIAVLDIDGSTLGPIYEDIAYFGVNLRTPLLVAIAQGYPQDRGARDRVERTFVEAYFESATPPWPALRVFDVLVLLDKWSGRPPRPVRLPGGRAVAAIGRRLVDRFFRAELERILVD